MPAATSPYSTPTGCDGARSFVRLRGRFALDAVSADGRLLYFIQSLSRDGARYAVRAYDVARHRLLRAPVVDPAEGDEPMRGSPIARTMSRDGRWAYTLYGGEKAAFLHALDTENARAKCIDLDELADRRDLMELRLGLDPKGLVAVRDGAGRAVLKIDPRGFVVRHRAPARARGGGVGWVEPAVGAAVLVLLGAVAVRAGRRGRRGSLGELRL